MLVIIVFSLGIVSTSAETVIYVDDDAPLGGDGKSWETAYRFLQDGLASAENIATEASSPGGRGSRRSKSVESEFADDPCDIEVRVAQGIYRPDKGSNQRHGDRLASFELTSGVALRGGFAGLEMPDPDVRNIKQFRTILSGDLADNDVDVHDPCDLQDHPTRLENSYNVVELDRVSRVQLNGLRVSGGYGDLWKRDELASTIIGAGVSAIDSNDVLLNDCDFIDNFAMSDGGGCIVLSGNNITISNCMFTSNSSGSGGALSLGGSGIVLANCKITNNHARSSGGGLAAGGEITIIDSILSENVAVSGGGGAARFFEGTVHLMGCTVSTNSASWGGGLAITSSKDIYTFHSCLLSNNQAMTDGGALLVSTEGGVSLANCIVEGNSAKRGVGIYGGRFQELKIVNCTIHANKTEHGAVADFESEHLKNSSHVDISNSIITEGKNAISTSDTIVSIDFSLLPGGHDCINDPNNNVMWREGNIGIDPVFVDPGYWGDNGTPEDPNDDFYVVGDYHLKSQAGRWDPISEAWTKNDVTSPCIDSGDPNSPIMHEPFPNGGVINMGAYGGTVEASKSYFREPVCETVVAGDLNGDCRVDFEDLVILMRHWNENRID